MPIRIRVFRRQRWRWSSPPARPTSISNPIDSFRSFDCQQHGSSCRWPSGDPTEPAPEQLPFTLPHGSASGRTTLPARWQRHRSIIILRSCCKAPLSHSLKQQKKKILEKENLVHYSLDGWRLLKAHTTLPR